MRKILFLPKTRLGKWSAGLIIVFFLLFMALQPLVASGQRGGETFFSNLTLAVPALIMGISGVSAFFTGIVAITKNKERAILVFISTLIGFFVLWFWLGEILSPH